MTYYQATIRIKNEPTGILETDALATEHQQPIMLEFKPREEIIEFQPS